MEEPKSLVLIAGAGPTGLMLALWLKRFKVPFRLVDRSPRRSETSRAAVVHARTLEFYRQLGISDQIVSRGSPIEAFQIIHEGTVQGQIALAEGGKGLSHFAHALSLPQDWHEEILENVLEELGARTERGVEVTSVKPGDEGEEAEVTLRHVDDSHEEVVRASFVAGCDGAHSVVRHAIGLQMEGGTYDKSFFVADAEVHPEWIQQSDRKVTAGMSRKDFCLFFLLPSKTNQARLIGLVPPESADSDSLTLDDIQPTVTRNLGVKIENVTWISKYKVHHRMASSFRKGRTFLLGDSAHIHSPVGGQGMNTGLGDATNLAWKLAAIHNHGATLKILQTYEEERMPFAKLLLDTTDYVFTLITNGGLSGSIMRNWVFPVIVPFGAKWMNLSPRVFKRTSQIEIEYRKSTLSSNLGFHGGAAAGDRLPYIQLEQDDNHASLDSSGWQAHIYGTAPDQVVERLSNHKIQARILEFSEKAAAQGLLKDALYLIRPDGYIGLVASAKELASASTQVWDYCDRWAVWSST